MSKLDELLQGVDVEWKSLGEISEIYGGLKGKNKSDFTDGNAKYVTYKNIYNNIEVDFDTLEMVKVSQDENQYEVKYGDVLFTGSSENASEAGISSAITFKSDAKVYLNSFSFGLRFNSEIKLLPEFTKYLFRSKSIRDEIIKTASGVTRYNVSKKRFIKIQIPIPPIEIQQEIVRVLDDLTSLTNQLTTELETERQNRKKQFEFFREQLFNNKSDNESWKILEEIIIKTYSGSTPRAGDVQYYNNGTIPWLRTQEVRFCEILDTEIKITELAVEKTGAKWIPINCVIIAISGATAGRSAINKIPLTTNQHCLCLEINSDKALYKYVYHWIKFNYENIKSLGRGARGDLNSSIIKNFKIPIPSLEEQERIVKLLDQFDATHTAIEEEITKEIKLRTQQYEYYREKLLSFPSLRTT